MNKLIIDKPIIVEGKYDKAAVCQIAYANVIITDGFGIFKENEKRGFIRRLAETRGVIVLTDSDGAGLVIRRYINSILPAGSVYHTYIPRITGKERRKNQASKEGLLGVEGIDRELLIAALKPYSTSEETEIGIFNEEEISKIQFYGDGFSGKDESAKKRDELAQILHLPQNLSSKALLAAINMLKLQEQYKEYVKQKINDVQN